MANDMPAFGFGIFSKILIAMLAVSLGPLAAYWYLGRLESIRDWTANGETSLRQSADAIAARVDGWIDANVLALRYTASLPAIRSMSAADQDPILKALAAGYPWSYLAFVADPAGKSLGRSDGKAQTDYSDRGYYRAVIRNGQDLGHQTLIGRTSGKPALVLAVPIRVDGKPIGLVALASNLADIARAVVSSAVGKTGFAFLLDADGKVVAHPKEALSDRLEDLTRHPAYLALKGSGKDQVVARYREGGRDVVAVARKVALGWTLVVQQDESEVFVAVGEADRFALYLIAAAVAVVLILSLFLASRLTRPIVALTEAADQLSRGVPDVKILATGRRDEIGALARAVDRMGMSIKVATQRLRSKRPG